MTHPQPTIAGKIGERPSIARSASRIGEAG